MSVCTYFAILFVLYFFAYPATTDIYTLSLHDALPILQPVADKRRRIKRSDSLCTEKAPATGKPRSTQARPGEYQRLDLDLDGPGPATRIDRCDRCPSVAPQPSSAPGCTADIPRLQPMDSGTAGVPVAGARRCVF